MQYYCTDKKSVSPNTEETLPLEQKSQVRADAPTFPDDYKRSYCAIQPGILRHCRTDHIASGFIQ